VSDRNMTQKTYPQFNLLRALTYPLDLSPLLIVFITSIFITFALLGPIMAVLVVFGLGMFSLWFLKYAFLILTDTAEGHVEIPVFSDAFLRAFENYRPAKLLIILISHIVIMGQILSFDLYLGYIYGVVLLVLLPAILSVLAMEDKLINTFNPNILVSIINMSGKYYWYCLSLFFFATAFVIALFQSDIAQFISVFITLYLILVSFHIIGLMLYIRRNEMGYATVHSPEQDSNEIKEDKLKQYQRIASNVYSRYRQPTALPYLENQLNHEPIDAYRWFYTEIVSWDIKPKFKRLFFNLYLSKLCDSKNPKEACRTYCKCITLDPEFEIDDNGVSLCLLNHAISLNDTSLINNFSSTLLAHTQDKDCHQETLLTLLKYYTEKNIDDTQSQTILDLLIEHHPSLINDERIVFYKTMLSNSV